MFQIVFQRSDPDFPVHETMESFLQNQEKRQTLDKHWRPDHYSHGDLSGDTHTHRYVECTLYKGEY